MVVDFAGGWGGGSGGRGAAELIPERRGSGSGFGVLRKKEGALTFLPHLPSHGHGTAYHAGGDPQGDEGGRAENHDCAFPERPQCHHVHQQVDRRHVRDGVGEQGPVAPGAEVVEVEDEVFREEG